MSRHRNVRALDADDEYDSFNSCYGHSVEEDFCISPQTEAQFLYNRSSRTPNLSSFFESPEPVHEDSSGDEGLQNSDSLDRLSLDLNPIESAKLQSCVEALQNVVGDTIPESNLRKAAIENQFDLEKSLNAVLQDEAPKPPRSKNPVVKSALRTPVTESTPDLSKSGSKKATFSAKTENKELVSPIVKRKEMSNKRDTTPVRTPKTIDKKADIFEDQASASSENETVSSKNKTDLTESTEITKVDNTKANRNGKEIYTSERADAKPLINLVVIGHVDAGKSTLMGHLLYCLGNISQRNMHKFERDSKKLGKGSFMYAWVLDETPEERNRGITMDVAFSSFETAHQSITLLDAPGHKDFIPNMITGAAQADVAVLVVDATKGEFETGFEAGGQTREHTMLIRSLGVTELAVAVNKMDNANWDEDRFNDIRKKLAVFLKQVGFKESDVTFVPCSGLSGENLVSGPQDESFKHWYRGPTLVDAIDNFHSPERPVDKPFRMCVSDVFKGISGGVCAAGKIEAGFVKSGDRVLVLPGGECAMAKGISVEEQTIPYGFAGDHVILQLTGVDANNVGSGSMLCSVDRPVKVATRFEARLVIFNISLPITKGFQVILHYQSLSEQAVVKKLISQLNRNTGEVVKNKPRCILKNSSAVVEIEVNRPICIEIFKEFKELGRFMLRSNGVTIAAGLVTDIK